MRYLENKLRQEKLELSTKKIQDARRSTNLTVINDSKDISPYYLKVSQR